MQHCDYVIVGAGSAGCVLADRLSAEGLDVLVLEAGGEDNDVMVKAPAFFAGMFQGPNDWNYNSEPERGLHGRRVYLPRGRLVGGCSSMNAMIYMRGAAADYDRWAKEYGAAGWSYDDVLPYFIRSENNADIHDRFHGTSGPLHVTTDRWLSPHSQAFIESANAVGITHNPDFNGERQEGVGLFQLTVKDGQRCSSADAFLRPASERENLTLLTGATALRVLVEGQRAIGVEYLHNGSVETVHVGGEVILSAGAYNTPKLLMLSGIGPPEHLGDLGIDVAVGLDNVGRHLQDHPLTLLHWATNAGDTLADVADPSYFEQWMSDGTGKVSSAAAEAAVLWRSQEDLPAADFQIIFVPGFFWEHGFRRPSHPGMSIGLSYNGPTSRGEVRLRSSDPHAAPRIMSNLLGRQSELDAVKRAIDLVEEIATHKPLSSVLDERVNPGPGVDADRIEDWIRAETEHMYHASCTARIGSPEDGVVDPELRVHGVAGLRIADASVMPRITSGNTNAPTIMIGERAADLVLGHPVTAEPSATAHTSGK